jgi:hypothetical protein
MISGGGRRRSQAARNGMVGRGECNSGAGREGGREGAGRAARYGMISKRRVHRSKREARPPVE